MKILFLILSLIPILVQSEDKIDWKNLNPATVIKAIDQLEASPIKAKEKGILPIVLNYAEASNKVKVTISSDLLPWLKEEKKVENADILLVAFVAGNMKGQLTKSIKKDNSLDGLKFMIKTYSKLLNSKQIINIKKLDEWAKLKEADLKKLIKS